jgi:hypothetical protein
MAPASPMFEGFQGTVKWRGWGTSSRDRRPVSQVLGDTVASFPLEDTAQPVCEGPLALRKPAGLLEREATEADGADLLLQLALQRFHLLG